MMAADHPETELVPYLSGGLSADEREQVEHHLQQCVQCRRSAESSLAILSQLADAIDDVRTPDWMQYRAELRHKLRTVQARRLGLRGRWWWREQRPFFGWRSMAVGAVAIAAIAIVLVMHRGGQQIPGVDQLELQQEMSGADVGLLANYHVVEHLDLLENYDVIEHLDEVAPGDRPNHETPS